jgi:hypothetical protein
MAKLQKIISFSQLKMGKQKLLILLFCSVFILTAIFIAVSNFRMPLRRILFSHSQETPATLEVSNNEIKFLGNVLETRQTLPYLFLEKYLKLNDNALYTYSIIDDLSSGMQFLRLDKMVQNKGGYGNAVTGLYTWDFNKRAYVRVLVTDAKQNSAEYPQTEILTQNPLTIRFYYDIARPLECYGPGCRSFWADHYRWDNRKNKFILVNSEYKDFYQNLYKEYKRMDEEGCALGDSENIGLKTLRSLYDYNKTIYCSSLRGGSASSSREELNRFIETMRKIEKIIQ